MHKHTDHTRIIFLREFTKELILNRFRERKISQSIEIEKIRQQFVKPNMSAEDVFKRVLRGNESNVNDSSEKYQISISDTEQKRKPVIHRTGVILPSRLIQPMTRKIEPVFKKSMQEVIATQKQRLAEIKPEPQPKPQGFNLGKLEPILQDNSIQIIECSGPGKNVLVRKYNQPNVTKIILSQEEITDIINNFSREARIPVVGGILKAAVGSLVISAVISDFVGSRFIINKITPFSMLMEQ